MSKFKKGDSVSWKWGNGTAEGKVIDVTPDKVTIQSKGEDITRNGSADDQAVTIETDESKVLKLESELSKAS